jgi:antitoxin HicB
MAMYDYPVKMIKSCGKGEKGYTVTFPDVPEAITEGDDRDEALENAVEALEVGLSFYVEAGKALPRPSVAHGRPTVRPRLIAALKRIVYSQMKARKMRKSDLKRLLSISSAAVERLLDLNHDSRLDHLENALRLLGKDIDIKLRPHHEENRAMA